MAQLRARALRRARQGGFDARRPREQEVLVVRVAREVDTELQPPVVGLLPAVPDLAAAAVQVAPGRDRNQRAE